LYAVDVIRREVEHRARWTCTCMRKRPPRWSTSLSSRGKGVEVMNYHACAGIGPHVPAGQGTQLLWVPPVLKVPAGHTAHEPRLEWWPAAQASVVGLVVGLPLGCNVTGGDSWKKGV